MAKEKGVKNISKLKKEDLIQILSKETNTIPTEEIKKEEKNSSVTSGGYKLTNEVAKAVSEKCAIVSTGPRVMTREEIEQLLLSLK